MAKDLDFAVGQGEAHGGLVAHVGVDASSKSTPAVSKLLKVWENRQAQQAARVGGLGLMAVSLAACGGSSDSTTTTTPTTPTTPVAPVAAAAFELTPLVDIASATQALNGSLSSAFRFTSGNDTVNGITATIQATDTLLDGSTTDADVLNVTSTGAMAAMAAINIETVNLTLASGAASGVFTNFSGLKNVNVSGSVAGTVEDAGDATVALSGYTRVLTLDFDNFDGTTAAGNADVVNLSVSGATWGTTAATQTGIDVTIQAAGNGTDGTLETLNIASTGSAANTFALTKDADTTFSTINITGSADAVVRVAAADVSGRTVDGSKNTGNVSLNMDTNGAITVNAANWSGIDNIVLRDSVTGANDATLNSVKSGQNVVVANSVATLTVAAQGATYSALAASAGLELNGTSTTAGVTVTTYNAENIKELSLVSKGLASSTSTTAANTVTTLDGDFTTITITGDTSLAITNLDIDATQTATSTSARAVKVDASAMTGNAFVSITAVDDSKVTYTLTGSLGDDTLVANASGSTLSGGLGDDTLTGGNGTDVIDGGAGADHIDVSYGTSDKLTGGSGADTYDINAIEVAAVAHVITSGDVDGGLTLEAANDDLVVVVNGVTYKQDILTDGDTADDITVDFIASYGGAILAAHGVTVTATSNANTAGLVFTGKSDGTQFTVDVSISDAGAIVAVTETETAAGTPVRDVSSEITDFSAGDILDISGIVKNGTAKVAGGGGYYEGDLGASFVDGTDYDVVVLTGAQYADFGEAEAAIAAVHGAETDDVVFVFLNSTLGYAQMYFDVDLGADNDVDAEDLIASFTNITSLSDLAAAMSTDTFVV